ncbi:2594_t:CDS:2, partial [Cetraspora pellucida]
MAILDPSIYHDSVNSTSTDYISVNSTTFNTTLDDLITFANQNEITLIGLFIPIAFAMLMYIFRRCACNHGQNFAYSYCLLLAYDFAFEVAFFIKHSHVIEALYFPSMLSWAVPAFINLLAGLIISYKTSHNNFFITFLKSFICVIDIRLLQIYTNQYQDIVLWFSGINLLIEDIPQLVIQ